MRTTASLSAVTNVLLETGVGRAINDALEVSYLKGVAAERKQYKQLVKVVTEYCEDAGFSDRPTKWMCDALDVIRGNK